MTRALALSLAISLLSIAPASAQEPTRELAGVTTCRAGDVIELGTSSVHTLRPELAFDQGGRGLAMWPAGGHVLHVRALGAAGPGALVTAELDHATGLGALAPAGRGFVAVATAPLCNRRGVACLRARAFGPDGAALGPAYQPEPDDHWDTLTAQARLPDALAVAWAQRDSASIELFRIAEDGSIARESHPLRGDCTGDAPITALASDGATVVALGTTECSAPPRFLLALGARRQPIHAVPEDARVVRFTSEGGVATVVYEIEGRRPRLVRFAVSDGHLVEGPLALAATDALPLDVADVLVAELSTERGRVVLRRADLSGTEIGEPVEIAAARGRVVTRLAWDGRRFFVLWAARTGRTWTVRARAVSCFTT